MTEEDKIKDFASYFHSIEKTYSKPIDHWMQVLDTMQGKKHREMVYALKSGYHMSHKHANILVALYYALNDV